MRKENLSAKRALIGLLICAVWAIPVLAQLRTERSLVWSWGSGWTVSGNLNVARSNHTATLLPGGKVLVVGGYSGKGASGIYLSSAELYNPGTATWTPTGSTFYQRSGHTATLLPNGRVLVAGGIVGGNGKITNTELYDPATGNWYATGRLTEARPEGFTATLLANGKVLVVGGYNQYLPYPKCFQNSTELYDPVSQVWTRTGDLNYGRYAHSATLLPNGKVLVVGGSGGIGGIGNSAELYDPATGVWTTTGSLFFDRFGHTATRLQNGKVLVSGGLTYSNSSSSLDTVELYDPATENWYSVGRLNVARRYHEAILLPNGKVLVVGGLQSSLSQGGYLNLNSAELYDPTTFVWTPTDNLNVART